MANNKLVLWGAAKHWKSSSPVGSHGYAKEFVKNGWKVAFLSTVITPWHKLFTKDKELLRKREIINKNGGVWHENGMLWEYVPWSLVHSKWMPSNWIKYDCGSLNKVMMKNNISQPDIVWVDTPEYIALFDQYPQAKHIMRIADKNQYFKGMTKKIIKKQIEYAKKADLAIVTSYALEEEFKSLGIKRLIRVPNGVDLDRFTSNISTPAPNDVLCIKKPIALYVGMIEDWFDLRLLAQAAQRLPNVNFVIIGKIGIDIKQTENINNIIFLGPRSPRLVSAYMKYADVGIIPFVRNEFVDAINPVKYYEYIACGLPVVATESKEFKMLKEKVFLAKNIEEFICSIKEALAVTIEYKEDLIRQSGRSSWHNRWKTIMDHI